jgi:urea-proton symporter
VLSYTLISGLEASIITDFAQLGVILVMAVVVLPLAGSAAGGIGNIAAGFGGVDNVSGMFDPGVAFSFGIVTSIGLIAGSISDQSNWQRAFAVKKDQLTRAFVFGSILFGLVPISLSVLGFIAANPALQIALPPGVDVSMIGIQTISQLLPPWAVLLFAIALLGALSSSFDAGLCAAASMWVTDVARPKTDEAAVRSARQAMIGINILGLLVAMAVLNIPNFGLDKLWWIFNTIAACVMVPTVMALYSDRVTEAGVFWGVLVSFVVGIPVFIYSNIINSPRWIVGSSLFIVAVSTLFTVLSRTAPGRTPQEAFK